MSRLRRLRVSGADAAGKEHIICHAIILTERSHLAGSTFSVSLARRQFRH